MKKILNITLIIILAFVLASCFGDETTTNGDSSVTFQGSGNGTETSNSGNDTASQESGDDTASTPSSTSQQDNVNCKFSGEISQCDSAVKKYLKSGDGRKTTDWITPGSSLREIEDFVCLQDSPERRALQIAMDKNFKEVDDEMDKYLSNLANSKDVYFGKNAQYTYLDGVNHIFEKRDFFRNKFLGSGEIKGLCNQSMEDAAECLGGEIGGKGAIDFINGSTGDCFNLVSAKMAIFVDVAANMLLLNKQQVARDEKKLYDQELRTKYDEIVKLMMINLGYLERIRKKWPSKTKNAH